jgi:hypothetical protein
VETQWAERWQHRSNVLGGRRLKFESRGPDEATLQRYVGHERGDGLRGRLVAQNKFRARGEMLYVLLPALMMLFGVLKSTQLGGEDSAHNESLTSHYLSQSCRETNGPEGVSYPKLWQSSLPPGATPSLK